jgi:hypothetical protein
LARVNEGNAMNLTSGIFTAPCNGIYFFSFAGHARFPSSSSTVLLLEVDFYLNNKFVEIGYLSKSNTVAGQWSPLTLQSTLNLKTGDQVWVQIYGMSPGVYLFDNVNPFTHFTGFMLEEEIVASL